MAQSTIASVGTYSDAGVNPLGFYDSVNGYWWRLTLRSASSTTLYSYYSSDGVTWTAGATLTITAATYGRQVSCWYQAISGTAVVHLCYTHGNATSHVRGTISGTTLTWGSAVTDSSTSSINNPAGNSCCIDTAGYPFDFIAGGKAGDPAAGGASHADTGSSWTTGFGTLINANSGGGPNAQSMSWCHPLTTTRVLVLTDDGTGTPPVSMKNLEMGKCLNNGSGTVTATSSTWPFVFSSSFASDQDSSGWAAAYQSDSVTHVVAYNQAGAAWLYSTVSATGSNLTAPTATAVNGINASVSPKSTSGMALIYDGTTLWLFTIDSASGNDVKYCTYNGSSWSSWTAVGLASATRNYLSAAYNGSNAIQVFWVEGTANPWSLCTIQVATSSTTTATAGLTLNSPSLAGTAAEVFTATAGLTLSAPVLGAQASYETAAAGLTLQSPSVAAQAAEIEPGSGALTLSTPSLAAQGVYATAAAGLTLSALSLAAQAAEIFTATGGVTLASPTLAAQGVYSSATAALVLQSPSLAAQATIVTTATAGLVLSPLVIAAQGSYETATGGLTLSTLGLAASALEIMSATAALTLSSLKIAAAASEIVSATAALTLSPLQIAAQGVSSTAAAALTLSTLTLAAAAVELVTAAAGLTLSSPRLAAQAASTTAAAALTLSALLLSAGAAEVFPATAALTLSTVILAASVGEIWTGTAGLVLATLLFAAAVGIAGSTYPGVLTLHEDTFTLAYSGPLTLIEGVEILAAAAQAFTGTLTLMESGELLAAAGTSNRVTATLALMESGEVLALAGPSLLPGTLTLKEGSANAPLLHLVAPVARPRLPDVARVRARRAEGMIVIDLLDAQGARLPCPPEAWPVAVLLRTLRQDAPLTVPAWLEADGTGGAIVRAAWPRALPRLGLYYCAVAEGPERHPADGYVLLQAAPA